MSLLEQLDMSARVQSALSEGDFDQLRTFIYQHTGIYFQDNKRYLLESRVGRRLQATGINDYRAYLRYVQNGGFQQEMPLLLNAITINETFFFRNPAQLDLLETEIIPELVRTREKVNKPIRIWSSASSTGDEAYSMAIMIRERILPKYPHLRFELTGTDINTEVLDIARSGVFGQYAIRNVQPDHLKRYFVQDGDRYSLRSEIRNMVTFKHLNLMDQPSMRLMRQFDVIICANVLIYFDSEAKQKVVESFYNSLNPGGYLLVGFSETLYGVTQAFQPVRFEKTIAYRKG